MTRHDQPAEGDAAGVALTDDAVAFIYDWTPEDRDVRARMADALRDLLAAAEQRGRVAALREAADDDGLPVIFLAAHAVREWLRRRAEATERAQ